MTIPYSRSNFATEGRTAPSPSDAAGAIHERQSILRVSALLIVLLFVLARKPIDEPLPHYFLYNQDMPVIAGLLGLLAVFFVWRVPQPNVGECISPRVAAIAPLALAALVAGVGIAGHYLVLWGYAFSRDEQLALFDAHVFQSGRLAVRLPLEWRPFAEALNTMYTPIAMRGTGWISMYRPVNSAMLALMAQVATPALVNPLLAAAGLLATWRVACRVLPGDREAQFVAVLLYATSAQVLAMAMTSYAMTGHLALNMIWLALLLMDRWYGHLGAILVGMLAIGLHQIAYHPLFAGPFLFFLVVMRRRWALSAIYAVAYAGSILAWSKYSALPLHELGVVGHPTDVDTFILTRIGWALSAISPEYAWMKAANLIRFIAWQNLLLVPLVVAGAAAAVRTRDPCLVAMLAVAAVLIVTKLVLYPNQGHGWGYRYLHGAIGVIAILGAAGWRALRARGAIAPAHLAAATAATLLLTMPWLLSQARHFSGLYASVDRAIARTDADAVVIDDWTAEFTNDLVINDPDLARAPVRLLASKLTPADMAPLCAMGSIAFVDAHDLAPIGTEFDQSPEADGGLVPPLREAARAAGCAIRPIAPIAD